MALTRLDALKGIEETEEELRTISEHVLVLENILGVPRLKPVRLLILLVDVVVTNDGAEIDILNHLETRPQDCWHPEACFQIRDVDNLDWFFYLFLISPS